MSTAGVGVAGARLPATRSRHRGPGTTGSSPRWRWSRRSRSSSGSHPPTTCGACPPRGRCRAWCTCTACSPPPGCCSSSFRRGSSALGGPTSTGDSAWSVACAALLLVVRYITGRRPGSGGNAAGRAAPAGLSPVPLGTIAAFAILVGAALYARTRPETHKRLMLLATIALLTPALARFRFIGGGGPPVAITGTCLFVVACLMYDRASHGRVHPAFLWGGLFLGLAGGALRDDAARRLAGRCPVAHAVTDVPPPLSARPDPPLGRPLQLRRQRRRVPLGGASGGQAAGLPDDVRVPRDLLLEDPALAVPLPGSTGATRSEPSPGRLSPPGTSR